MLKTFEVFENKMDLNNRFISIYYYFFRIVDKRKHKINFY